MYPAYATKDFGVFINAAHNDWLQWAADGGIPLIGCLFLLFGASVLLVPKVPWAFGVPVIFLHSLCRFSATGTAPAGGLFASRHRHPGSAERVNHVEEERLPCNPLSVRAGCPLGRRRPALALGLTKS